MESDLGSVIKGERSWHIEHADVLRGLGEIPSDSVHCCITSPPYYLLRAYSTDPQIWGGQKECSHSWGESYTWNRQDNGRDFIGHGKYAEYAGTSYAAPACMCEKCGAWKGELGAEPSVQMFVQNLVEIFREVKRVLHPSGVCFINLGDSSSGSGKGPTGHNGIGDQSERQGFTGAGKANTFHNYLPDGIPAKNILLIPERLAIALQEDGWYIRSRIAWCKTSALPESVTDRPVRAWEHIWMITKRPMYFYDDIAVRVEEGDYSHNLWNWWPIPSEHFTGEFCQTCEIMYDGGFRQAIMNQCGECGAVSKTVSTIKDAAGSKSKPCRKCKAQNPAWSRWCPSCKSCDGWVSHYAAFPSALATTCIRAGSSEHGVCSACLAPWRRVFVKDNGSDDNGELKRRPAGWEAGCACNAKRIPSIILDPFSGTGTVVLNALRLGRAGIGIELSESYHKLSLARVRGDMPLFAGL